MRGGTCSSHVFTGSHDFVNEKQLLGKNWSYIHKLSLNHVIIPDVGNFGRKGLSCEGVDTVGLLILDVGFLDLEKSILGVESGVLRKGSWNNKKGI